MGKEKKTNRDNRKTWQYPWGYKESFLIVAELLLLGLIIEVLSKGKGFTGIEWPLNVFIGIGLMVTIAVLHFFFRSNPVIKWLSSVPAAVSSISFFAFLILLLGFIPQGNPHMSPIARTLGLYHIKNSWIFVVSGLYLLLSLGLVIFRRSGSLKRKNIGFILNHAGMWIVLAAGSLGTGDLIRVTTQLNENGESVSIAVNRENEVRELPFSMKLIDFRIDEYLPGFGIADIRTGALISENNINSFEARINEPIEFGQWYISVDTLYRDAFLDSTRYYPVEKEGSAPAALVTVYNNSSNQATRGWVSCGSYLVPHNYLQIDDFYLLVMLTPEAEKFTSEIVFSHTGFSDTVAIEVNKPYKIKGYNIYQLSYDDQMGKWSKVSIIEAIKDPWLPVVYFGIFLLLGGAAYLFWIGNEPKKEER